MSPHCQPQVWWTLDKTGVARLIMIEKGREGGNGMGKGGSYCPLSVRINSSRGSKCMKT